MVTGYKAIFSKQDEQKHIKYKYNIWYDNRI